MAVDEWESRRLCPDGACTGILDADGVCGTCGARGEAARELYRDVPLPEPPTLEPGRDPEDSAEESERRGADLPSTEEDWSRRTVCPDGSCTGVLGPDGVCGTCGRKW